MKTTSICPHINCLVNHNGNPCNCNMAQYCSQCKKDNPTTPSSAQTEWKKETRKKIYFILFDMLKPINFCNTGSIKAKHTIDKIMSIISNVQASERTRLLSVESMKMEEENDYPEDLENGPRTRNSLRQSILSEMEKKV